MSSSYDRPDVDALEALYRMSDGEARRREWLPGARALVVLAVLLGVASWFTLAAHHHDTQVDMLAGVPDDGLVAADVGAPQIAGPWVVTSGSLLARGGRLWSGRPDAGPPNPATGMTGSSVLRAVSTRRDFRNMSVRVDLRLDGLVSTTRTPAQDWDGVHVFLRYHSPTDLYVVDLVRRDHTLAIKRKTPDPTAATSGEDSSTPDAGRAYDALATTRFDPGPGWHRYYLTIADEHGGVGITLSVDGRTVLSTVDRDPAALRGPGGVGLRGDNADFVVRRMTIDPAPAR